MPNHLIFVEMYQKSTNVFDNNQLLERLFKRLEKLIMPTQSAGK